jgi:CMP-N,N'-diacetyllegionaminic acid synthase
MKIICTICARGGSKGVKNKNIIKIFNKELIYYTINVAKKSKIFSDIVVSSDNKKILNISKKFGIKNLILRSKKYSTDRSSKILPIKDCLLQIENKKKIRYDAICDLDVTSPLRMVEDVLNAYKIFKKKNYSNLISVNPSRRNPYFNMVELDNNLLKISKGKQKFTCRQQLPKVFDVNASIYFWKRDALIRAKKVINHNTGIYIMPFLRSIDIDNYEDLKLVKLLIKK